MSPVSPVSPVSLVSPMTIVLLYFDEDASESAVVAGLRARGRPPVAGRRGMPRRLSDRLAGVSQLLGDRTNALLIHKAFTADQFEISHRQHPLYPPFASE